ncbi:MAG: tetratricopeptide repeat protein [Planctomycetota bacterium]|nr:tetratricopeptide repeat protein [Planctomycetota bacterium]MDA1141282.1 tetratricopeptide repeat protein [Planctomycetota bacterium]
MVDYLNGEDDLTGYELLEEGRYEEAVDFFKDALDLHPYSADVYAGLGHAYGELGEYAQASRAFQEGLKLSPCDEDIWLGLAMCFLKLNRLKDADICLDRLSLRLENDVEASLSLAFSFYQIERPEEAVSYCENVLAREPDNAEALALKSVCLQEVEGTTREVRSCMHRALLLEPARWDWMEYYANLIYEEEEYEEAFLCFDKIPLNEIRTTDSFERLIKLLKRFRKDQTKIQMCKRMVRKVEEFDSLEFFLNSLQEEVPSYED